MARISTTSCPGRADGNAPSTYAFRLIDRIVQHFDYLVDLHTASFGRINSLYVRADMNHPEAAQMAYLQRPQIIVHNPPSDQTLRGAVASQGVPAITVEIGNPQRFQRDYIRRATAGLRAVLARTGMIRRRSTTKIGESPVLCESSGWLYTDHGGLLDVLPALAERVAKDQVIARARRYLAGKTSGCPGPRHGLSDIVLSRCARYRTLRRIARSGVRGVSPAARARWPAGARQSPP